MESEFVRVCLFEGVLDEFPVVLVNDFWFVVVVFYEVFHFFFEGMEEHSVLVDVLEEVFSGRFFVFVELDLSVFVVEVE